MSTIDPLARYGQFGLHIIKAPSGKYIYVGTIPVELLIEVDTKFGKDYKSPAFNTEQEAIDYFTDRKPQ